MERDAGSVSPPARPAAGQRAVVRPGSDLMVQVLKDLRAVIGTIRHIVCDTHCMRHSIYCQGFSFEMGENPGAGLAGL